ncbi:Cytochrome c oxidase polypeptide 5, mitochondrial [Meristemomyces frigidus]|nr:Cytochrome c oxidase polypeptide 5, mitochondrial [Meristemomyces frigidus]
MFRTALRQLPTTSRISSTSRTAVQLQTRKAHAISNPTLANIEKRWEAMPPQEQADLWMALRDRMKVDWNELTLQEKKAAYWIAFGPHGPRAMPPPGEGFRVFLYTMYGIAASGIIFGTVRYFGRGPPPTFTKEHQEASNVYMKEQKMEPITGISSEGYSGMGMISTTRSNADLPKSSADDE